MASFLRIFQRIFNATSTALGKPAAPDLSTFAVGDRVLVQSKKTFLSSPLQHGQTTQLPQGPIAHNDIIGRTPLDRIPAHKGSFCKVTFPTLEQYTLFAPRKVTPVYSADANLIVSLLDIHVPAPTSKATTPLEILEAGTGHGSLTLHLARAIHAANPAPPSLPSPSSKDRQLFEDSDVWKQWKASRRAILHSLDISEQFSLHAQKLVRQFRRGMYSAHINFYVAHVGDWISNEIKRRRNRLLQSFSPFLSYVLLDMPSAHLQIENVFPAMQEEALIVIFAPSVTQIGDCVRRVQEKQLSLKLEKVVELGTGISSGRLWDVRLAMRRSSSNSRPERKDDDVVQNEEGTVGSTAEENTDHVAGAHIANSREPGSGAESDEPVLVCRPKVGERIVGGGFVGVWRRQSSN